MTYWHNGKSLVDHTAFNGGQVGLVGLSIFFLAASLFLHTLFNEDDGGGGGGCGDGGCGGGGCCGDDGDGYL